MADRLAAHGIGRQQAAASDVNLQLNAGSVLEILITNHEPAAARMVASRRGLLGKIDAGTKDRTLLLGKMVVRRGRC